MSFKSIFIKINDCFDKHLIRLTTKKRNITFKKIQNNVMKISIFNFKCVICMKTVFFNNKKVEFNCSMKNHEYCKNVFYSMKRLKIEVTLCFNVTKN